MFIALLMHFRDDSVNMNIKTTATQFTNKATPLWSATNQAVNLQYILLYP